MKNNSLVTLTIVDLLCWNYFKFIILTEKLILRFYHTDVVSQKQNNN